MKVNYTSNRDNVILVLTELGRKALKETAKIVRKDAKKRVKAQSEDTGTLRKNIATWVKKKGPEGPHLQIGVYKKDRAKKKGLGDAYYAHFIEFGTSKQAAKPFLRPSVMENIEEIRRKQAEIIPEIENEDRARALIDESEEETND